MFGVPRSDFDKAPAPSCKSAVPLPPLPGSMPEVLVSERVPDGDMCNIYRSVQISDPSFFKRVECAGVLVPSAFYPIVASSYLGSLRTPACWSLSVHVGKYLGFSCIHPGSRRPGSTTAEDAMVPQILGSEYLAQNFLQTGDARGRFRDQGFAWPPKNSRTIASAASRVFVPSRSLSAQARPGCSVSHQLRSPHARPFQDRSC